MIKINTLQHHTPLSLPTTLTPKVVSLGLYLGDQAYLRSSWNILDGFLVFASLIDIVVSMAGGAKILGVLRVLRLLRTLRPLRYEGGTAGYEAGVGVHFVAV